MRGRQVIGPLQRLPAFAQVFRRGVGRVSGVFYYSGTWPKEKAEGQRLRTPVKGRKRIELVWTPCVQVHWQRTVEKLGYYTRTQV